ncbi:hypothetical protein GCM10022415_12440 [Knoellia locipacati]|uniref:Uncharacterized protein n=1 Tax=Knoellia locipacati TaxID=882824 RepID=A0A512SZ27_9MICO|nr:hypothetical protein [Knoellia locipacati]GEQ13194.1 hypothetical protein KLO01_12410 [Knoellia locipacati]
MPAAQYNDHRNRELAVGLGALVLTAVLAWQLTPWVLPVGAALGALAARAVHRRADSQRWMLKDHALIYVSGRRRQVLKLAYVRRVSAYPLADMIREVSFESRRGAYLAVPLGADDLLLAIGGELKDLGVDPDLGGEARELLGWSNRQDSGGGSSGP